MEKGDGGMTRSLATWTAGTPVGVNRVGAKNTQGVAVGCGFDPVGVDGQWP